MNGKTSYDPIDPDHRIERGRERTAFFRQTGIFLLVALTMTVFVPLALWQKNLALPFLGWMAFMPAIAAGLGVALGTSASWVTLLLGSTFRAAATCIVLFFAITFLFSPVVLAVLGAGLAIAYVFCAMTGRLWSKGETP